MFFYIFGSKLLKGIKLFVQEFPPASNKAAGKKPVITQVSTNRVIPTDGGDGKVANKSSPGENANTENNGPANTLT